MRRGHDGRAARAGTLVAPAAHVSSIRRRLAVRGVVVMGLSPADRLEILALVARYNHAVDRADGEARAAMFVEDGVLDSPRGLLRGHAEIRAATPPAPGWERRRHWAANHVLHGDGDGARHTCCLAIMEIGDAPRILSTGRWEDTLRKQSGAWKFERRTYVRDAARE